MRAAPARHPVVVVGAGPVGLALAIDLAQRGMPVLLLDDDDTAVDRLARDLLRQAHAGDLRPARLRRAHGRQGRVVERRQGVLPGRSWSTASTCCPRPGTQRPAFINLQQYYVEGYLVERARAAADRRAALEEQGRRRRRSTPIDVAADDRDARRPLPAARRLPGRLRRRALPGARSCWAWRAKGRVFHDRFLIADVKMKRATCPTERWFWFDPPFHRNQSVLLHRQPDDVWRIDFQLGWDADPDAEKQAGARHPARAGDARRTDADVRARVGQRLHLRVPAHGALPPRPRDLRRRLRARRLAVRRARRQQRRAGCRQPGVEARRSCCSGEAPDALLDTYDARARARRRREHPATRRARTDFITPKSEISRALPRRGAGARQAHPFARALVNSGRLSVPAVLRDSPLNTPDTDEFAGAMVPGAPSTDAPVRVHGDDGWFLSHVGGDFTGVYFAAHGAAPADALASLQDGKLGVKPVVVVQPGMSGISYPGIDVIEDSEGLLATRFDARPGTFYLLRPDQHVCARWRSFDPTQVRAAVARATGNP